MKARGNISGSGVFCCSSPRWKSRSPTDQVFQPLQMLEALMILSVIKSVLIIGWFMHLKYEIAAMKWVMMIAVAHCLCLMCIFFADAFRIVQLGVR